MVRVRLWPLSAALSGQFPGAPALAYVITFLLNGATLAAILTLLRRAHVPHAPQLYLLLLLVESVTAVCRRDDVFHRTRAVLKALELGYI